MRIVLATLSLLSLSQGYRKTRYNDDQFVVPVDCLNDGYDLNAQLGKKDTSSGVFYHQGPLISDSDRNISSGPGHSWISFGTKYGQSCLEVRNLDGDEKFGCAPFSDVTKQFKRFQQCFNKKSTVTDLKGRWFDSDLIKAWKKGFSLQNDEVVLYRLAILAERDGNWLSDQAFESLFNQTQLEHHHADSLVRGCLEEAQLNRKKIKCWSTVMGAPGYGGPTIVENTIRGFSETPQVKKVCEVPTMCGRLAASRLHHLSALRYDNYMIFGAMRTIGMSRSWKTTSSGRLVNLKCSLNQNDLGHVVCWHYPLCLMEMMKQVCAEHSACCPSMQVHEICASNLLDPRCTMCTSLENAKQSLTMASKGKRKATKIIQSAVEVIETGFANLIS